MGTRRGESPPNKTWGFNKHGEGAGHEVKKHKGSGYARSTHMKGDVGPQPDGHVHKYMSPRTEKSMAHTGYHSTAEHKGYNSAKKLPMETHVPIRGNSIAAGDHFEGEIKEHFPGKKGVAGINDTSMPHKNSPVPADKGGHGHGHVRGKAEHHPSMGKAHNFRSPMTESHGYGHDHERRVGFLRMSGHKSAHLIGKR